MAGIAEQIFRAGLRGPFTTKALSAVNQWAGRTAVLSGISTATVSTTAVRSDAIVRVAWTSDVASNVAQVVKVQSLTQGAYFGFTVTPAPVGTDFTILWELVRTT